MYSHSLYSITALTASRFCDELKPTGHAQLLTPYLPHYIQQLAAMSGEFPEDVVVMVTEALQLVIQVCLFHASRLRGTVKLISPLVSPLNLSKFNE